MYIDRKNFNFKKVKVVINKIFFNNDKFDSINDIYLDKVVSKEDQENYRKYKPGTGSIKYQLKNNFIDLFYLFSSEREKEREKIETKMDKHKKQYVINNKFKLLSKKTETLVSQIKALKLNDERYMWSLYYKLCDAYDKEFKIWKAVNDLPISYSLCEIDKMVKEEYNEMMYTNINTKRKNTDYLFDENGKKNCDKWITFENSLVHYRSLYKLYYKCNFIKIKSDPLTDPLLKLCKLGVILYFDENKIYVLGNEFEVLADFEKYRFIG